MTEKQIESASLKLTAWPDGCFEISDKVTGAVWRSHLNRANQTDSAPTGYALKSRAAVVEFSREDQGTNPPIFNLSIQRNGRTVVLENLGTNDLIVVQRGFCFTDVDSGLYLTAWHGGAGTSVGPGLTATNVLTFYGNTGDSRLQMISTQKRGSVLLLSWDDPYIQITRETRGLTLDEQMALAAGDAFYQTNKPTSIASLSFAMQRGAKRLEFTPLGKGDYVKAAKEYRQILSERGKFVTLREKAKVAPSTELLLGAPYMRMWGNKVFPHPDSKKADYLSAGGTAAPGKLTLGPSFDDVGKLVMHFKNTLGFRRVHVLMTGWQNMGYDRKLPEVLPTASEAGGDEAMAHLSKLARDAGCTIAFHDDYAIAFPEATTFDPRDAKTNQLENAWFGGPQWECCPQRKMKYARRNVSEIQRLFHLNAYHLDIEMAGVGEECANPDHPSDKRGNLEAKRELARLVRELTGPVGSEDGMECGIDGFAYFENWPSYAGPPLGELVFRECMQFYELYNAQRYLKEGEGICACLREIVRGRMFTFPAGTFCEFYMTMRPINGRYGNYLDQDPADMQPVPKDNFFGRCDNGWGQHLKRPWDVWMKNLYEVEGPLNEETAHAQMTNFVEGEGWARSQFADGTEVTIELWGQPIGARLTDVSLPAHGFLVKGPRFQAFHALEWNGIEYKAAPLFAIRSLDGQPLESSRRIRVYHGFGPSAIALRTRQRTAVMDGNAIPVVDGVLKLEVPREAEINLR